MKRTTNKTNFWAIPLLAFFLFSSNGLIPLQSYLSPQDLTLVQGRTNGASYSANLDNKITPSSAIKHSSVFIDGNTELAAFCTEGSGIPSNPFIIKNYIIDATTAHGIEIRNTNASLTIRDCVISNGESEFYGISLLSCSFVNISGNTLQSNKHGIYAESSYNNTFSANLCSNNHDDGIHLYWSDNNSLSNNICQNNRREGIKIESSSQNTIYKNNCTDNLDSGISITYTSDLNTIVGNNCSQNKDFGLSSWKTTNNTFMNNTMEKCGIQTYQSTNISLDPSNKINGRSVRYFENEQDMVFSAEENVGIVILVNCTNSLIKNLEISDTYNAITVHLSSNISISGCECTHNERGILVDESHNITLSGNTCSDNKRGILLVETTNSTIQNNICQNNDVGIYLEEYCTFDTIQDNLCAKNNQAGIYLEQTSYTHILGNNCTANGGGIKVFSSSENNTISGNNCSQNTEDGILLSSSDFNWIQFNNNSANIGAGIRLSASNNNTIANNTCIYNHGDGIELDTLSLDNILVGNYCFNNNIPLESNSNENWFSFNSPYFLLGCLIIVIGLFIYRKRKFH